MGEMIGETPAEKKARLEDAQARLKAIAPHLAAVYMLLHDGEALDVNLDEKASGIIGALKQKSRNKLVVFRPGIHYTCTVQTGALGR